MIESPTAADAQKQGTRITRPQLLISVRDAAEAQAALAGGADWIDLKEPRRGALGAVDAATARSVVTCVAGRAPISAAAGELVDWPRAAARELLDVAGLSHVKLGLSRGRGFDWRHDWRIAHGEVAGAGMELVTALYVDEEVAQSPPRGEVLDLARTVGCRWILLDTFDKSAGALGDYWPAPELRRFLAAARADRRRTAVAGSLNFGSIAGLPLELVDVVAVRSAACRGTRTSGISRDRVAELFKLLSENATPHGRSALENQ